MVGSSPSGHLRRTRRLHKATSKLRRLVVVGHTGYITFEAVRWLRDAGVAYIHLDADGRVLATSGVRGLDNVKLRRAQALAADSVSGVEIMRRVLQLKLDGQRNLARRIVGDQTPAVSSIERQRAELGSADMLGSLRVAEAEAAAAYWQVWTDVAVNFANADRKRVPEHWYHVGHRRSRISQSNRQAANPANAIFNYLYALLEAETIIGCATVGLDPGIGILHADQTHRANLALDIMEAVRPEVDAYVYELLLSHRFRAADFHETRRGICRVLPPLTHALATTTPTCAAAVGAVIEDVAGTLLNSPMTTRRGPTPLTQRNRRAGRNRTRRRGAGERGSRPPRPPNNCADCGTLVAADVVRCQG